MFRKNKQVQLISFCYICKAIKCTSPANEFLLHRYINNKKFTGPANEFLYIGTAKNCTSPANEFLLKKDVKMDKRTDIHLTPSR